MNINEFLNQEPYGKEIIVKLKDGTTRRGIYDSHISEYDNEPDGESILIEIIDFGLTEIYIDEITEIMVANILHELKLASGK